MKLVVGIGGASGAPYAKRMLDILGTAKLDDVAVVFSDAGKQVWAHEVGSDPRELPFRRYGVGGMGHHDRVRMVVRLRKAAPTRYFWAMSSSRLLSASAQA